MSLFCLLPVSGGEAKISTVAEWLVIFLLEDVEAVLYQSHFYCINITHSYSFLLLLPPLLFNSTQVHGIIRRSSSFNTGRIDHIYRDRHETGVKLFLHYGDLCDATNLITIIANVKPDEIYNLGAMSHVKVSFDMPEVSVVEDRIDMFCLHHVTCAPCMIFCAQYTYTKQYFTDIYIPLLLFSY